MKKARLILGGGSAYGLAHIGVIKAIQSEFEITGIVGTSMGAIIGGCFACGMSPETVLELAEDFSTLELFNPLNLDFSRSGIFDGKTLVKLFEKWTESRKIEHALVPYVAVAFDLHRQLTVLIDKGLFADGMRASSSLPFIFAPHEVNDYAFVDGGVSHPLPLAFADRIPGEITISVNVLPAVSPKAEIYEPGKKKKTEKLNRYDVLLQSLMQNQGFMAIQSIVQYQPDIIIDAHHPDYRFSELAKAREFSEYGFKAAQKAIAEHAKPGFPSKLKLQYEKLLERIVTQRKS